MKSKTITANLQIHVPDLSDYQAVDPRRASSAAAGMKGYWDYVIDPVHFPHIVNAIHAGFPPVRAVADGVSARLKKAGHDPDSKEARYTRTFVGAIVAYWCTVNGFEKRILDNKDIKKPVGKAGWNRAQVMDATKTAACIQWK